MSRRHYNRKNACDRCGINFDKISGYPRRECDKENNWTSRWLCQSCWQKYDPNSQHNVQKSLRHRRTGNLDLNSVYAKGDLFEELTCKWRGVKNLNIENDNYRSPIDHSRDHELGIVQTRGKFYDPYNQRWLFGYLKGEWYKEFDNMICYCVSNDGKYIERIYIFPLEEIIKRTGIGIYKVRHSSKCSWYEKYRIKDEDILRFVNETWKMLYEEKIKIEKKKNKWVNKR